VRLYLFLYGRFHDMGPGQFGYQTTTMLHGEEDTDTGSVTKNLNKQGVCRD
jgi:hypothetical protein